MEELHPNVLHVAGKENDAADAISILLGMADNPDDELEWESQRETPITVPPSSREGIETNYKIPHVT